MTATLNSQIRYRNGYIEFVHDLFEPLPVEDAKVVESGCEGWGESNAVVLFKGEHYLATVEN